MRLMLPRRESERRSHHMAKHCDILSAIETRLSMLAMTYTKYTDTSVCCFIPGKVIDEIDRILTFVERCDSPPRTHELLQELRDISSMAIEHFDEVILPRLKQKIKNTMISANSPSSSRSPKTFIVQQSLTDELSKLKNQNKLNKQQICAVLEVVKKLKAKYNQQTKLVQEKSVKIKEQERRIHEQGTKLQEQETTIAELKRHVEEWDQKFSDLTAELIRAREDLASSSSPKSVTPKMFKSNIKPRVSLSRFYEIPRPIVSTTPGELERKRRAESIPNSPPFKITKTVGSQNLHDVILNKINENITSNISQSITDSFNKTISNSEQELQKDKIKKWPPHQPKTGIFGPFLSSSIEMIFKSPINSIKSRKRRISDEIDLK